MARVELSPDLDATVARDLVRPWMQRAIVDLQIEVQKLCPPARVWESRKDDKVRTTHREADGQTIPDNLRFILNKPSAGPTVHGQASRAAHHAEGHGGGRTGNIARKPEEIGTEQGAYPRDEQLSPGNRYNCRCEAVTIGGLIAATVITDPVEVAGTVVRGTAGSRFPRIAESEFGSGEDQGTHAFASALEEFAAKLQAAEGV